MITHTSNPQFGKLFQPPIFPYDGKLFTAPPPLLDATDNLGNRLYEHYSIILISTTLHSLKKFFNSSSLSSLVQRTVSIMQNFRQFGSLAILYQHAIGWQRVPCVWKYKKEFLRFKLNYTRSTKLVKVSLTACHNSLSIIQSVNIFVIPRIAARKFFSSRVSATRRQQILDECDRKALFKSNSDFVTLPKFELAFCKSVMRTLTKKSFAQQPVDSSTKHRAQSSVIKKV
jgi:hypothetical protein